MTQQTVHTDGVMTIITAVLHCVRDRNPGTLLAIMLLIFVPSVVVLTPMLITIRVPEFVWRCVLVVMMLMVSPMLGPSIALVIIVRNRACCIVCRLILGLIGRLIVVSLVALATIIIQFQLILKMEEAVV